MSNASDYNSDSDVPTDSLRKNKRFSLEAHDKDSGPNQQHNRKVGDKDKGRVPLDSKIEKESDNFAPDVGFNLDFLNEMKAEDVSASTMSHSRSEMPSREPAANVYTRDRIYEAVMKGDAEDLDGLYQYLSSKLKKLTNEEFREPKNGKTCLLKAMLNLKDGKNDTIPLLLEVAEKTDNLEKLVNAAYRDPYYKGHTALHTAIEKRNLPYVELLMSKKANVQAQAEGEFFQKRERGVGFYFGELPLSLAACTNQPSIVHYLMDNPYSKADITARDSKGNTVLHALVMVADDTTENTHFVTKMYDEILLSSTRLCPTLRIEEETNYKELTPLQLAAKLGRIEIFKHILRREMKEPEYQHLSRKFTEWVYGPVACSLYDLTSVDTHKETSGKKSVVEIIAFESDSKNRHKMIVLEPINELLQRKWETFGRPIFYTKFLLHVLYMLIFTVVAYNRPLTGKPPFAAEKTAKGGFRFVGEILTMVGSVYLFISQIVYFCRRRPSLKMMIIDGYFEVLFFLQSVILLCSGIIYLTGYEEYVAPMVLALVLGWINLLYYTRGFQQTGIYSVMIQKTILRDILRFLMVYIVFLFGFAAALVTLTGEPPAEAKNVTTTEGTEDSEGRGTYGGLHFALLELFKFTIGMGNLEFNENLKYKHFFLFLLILYVVLTYVLLLNMLIALMSETVNKISNDSKSIWKLQRAMTVLDIEKNLPQFLQDKMRSGIDMNVGKTPDGDIDKRRCFRVEEVNWNDWNQNVSHLKEEPVNGTVEELEISGKEGSPQRGNGFTNLLSRIREKTAKQEEQMPLNSVAATPSDGSTGDARRRSSDSLTDVQMAGAGSSNPFHTSNVSGL